MKDEDAAFRADLNRLVLMLIGDEDLNLVGISERLKRLEEARPTGKSLMWLSLAVICFAQIATLVLLAVRG